MKRIVLFFVSLLFVQTAFSQSAEKKDGPEITFEESAHDFGDIKQGDVVEHIFSFENTGNQPLIISNVKTTCGCTVPQWPREPIAPGESAQITVKFNSSGKMGLNTKIVRIISNVGEDRSVKISANILPSDS